MQKSQQWLFVLIAIFYSTTLFSQINVDIEINGINTALEENVRLYLSVEQQKNHPLLSEARLRRLHTKATLEIGKALQPFGYYRPVIESELTKNTSGNWLANYRIVTGPALPVGEFNLTISEDMQKDPEFQSLVADLPLVKGKDFNHLEYEGIKSSLARLAAERGYFNARFEEHRVEIDLDTYEARIHLNYNGGSRFLFGEVRLQQDVLDNELIQRYIPFTRGTPYTLYKLIDLQHALNDSDYFQTVEVSPGQFQPDSIEIPIEVTLTPRKPHRFSFGLGYGTDTGARAKAAWQMPLLNPQGHRFASEAKVSELGYSLGAKYSIPVLNPRTDQFILSTAVVNETTDTSESTIRKVGSSLKHSRGKWRETIELNYQQEDFTVADIQGSSTLLLPGISWSRTWGEKFIFAVDGLRFDIGLRGASKDFISDTDFYQLQGGIKAITSLGEHNRLITRGRLGSTWTDEFDLLPSSVRFFAGGAQSVRGYAYQSLGPLDANGEVIGGQHLMIGSIELEHSFNSKWGAALFYDGGNAIDNLNDKLERGAGFGLRWKSPVGPIRIDFANAISQDDKPWRLHITIGPDL